MKETHKAFRPSPLGIGGIMWEVWNIDVPCIKHTKFVSPPLGDGGMGSGAGGEEFHIAHNAFILAAF